MDKFGDLVVEAFVKNNSPSKTIIDSFDCFVQRQIPSMLSSMSPVQASYFTPAGHAQKVTLTILDHKLLRPMGIEADSTSRPLMPFECRERGLSYNGPFYAKLQCDIEWDGKLYSKVLNDVFLGYVPIMIYSSLCHVQDKSTRIKMKECDTDIGGYFIVKGKEKVLITQTDDMVNRMMYFSNKKAFSVRVKSEKNNRIFITTVKYINSRRPITITFPQLLQETPVMILLVAMGMKRAEIDAVFDEQERIMLQGSLTSLPTDNEEAKRRVMIREIYHLEASQDDQVSTAIRTMLLAHVDTTHGKICYLIKMVKKALQLASGTINASDRDSLINQRLHTSYKLLSTLFLQSMITWAGSIKKELNTKIPLLKTCIKFDAIKRIVNRDHAITDGFLFALATGTFNTKSVNRKVAKGLSQQLNTMSYIAKVSQITHVSVYIDSTMNKNPYPRYLHSTHYGRFCPYESPEGQKIGLEKTLAIGSYVSTDSSTQGVEDIIQQYILPSDVINICVGTDVYINGKYIGNTTEADSLIYTVRSARRSGQFVKDLSVTLFDKTIHISTSVGRLLRPLLIVEDGQLIYNGEDLSWQELLKNGCVEYLDPEEEQTCLVSAFPEDITERHTHCEIKNTLIHGVNAATIPFSNHNPAARNTFQCAMGKQAQGVPQTNFLHRWDKTTNILHYGQKKLVKTKLDNLFHIDDCPAGQNAIVAVMQWKGYGQEDSLVVNKASIERGLFRADHYTTCEEKASKNTKETVVFGIPDKKRHAGKYHKLDKDGIIQPGQKIQKRDCLVGKSFSRKANKNANNAVKEDQSLLANIEGTVDKVLMYQSKGGERNVKIRLRKTQIPKIGDKFCISWDSYVMTTCGWVKMKDITMQHKVATLRDGTYLEYVYPTRKYVFECKDEDLYHLDAQQVKIICTKNHKLYVKRRDKDYFEFIDAKDAFGKRVRHKKDSINDKVDQEFMNIKDMQYKMDFFLQLLGAFISDGFVDNGKKHRRIAICMKKQRKKVFIKKVLDGMGIHYNMKVDRVFIGNRNRRLIDYFQTLSVGAPNKYLPAFTWDLSQRQSIILMNALLQGDGSYNLNGAAGYYTSSKQLAQDVQRLALHCGWSGTIKLYKGREKGHVSFIKGRRVTSNYDGLAVRIVKKKNNPQVNHGHVHQQKRQTEEYIRYTGKVGCIEVPESHLFFYKEDIYSPPCWTGNSSRHGQVSINIYFIQETKQLTFSQKGIIGMVVPQEDLPFIMCGPMAGVAPDIILNPCAIPSRMTIAHLLETLTGKVNAIAAAHLDGSPFQRETAVETIADMLHDTGFQRHGNECMMSGMTGEMLQTNIFIGPVFYQRLKHMIDFKWYARSRGKRDALTKQPNQGRSSGGALRVGEMEKDTFTCYGVPEIIKDRMLYNSDRHSIYVCPTCKQPSLKSGCLTCKGKTKEVVTANAFSLLSKELKSMCVNVKMDV